LALRFGLWLSSIDKFYGCLRLNFMSNLKDQLLGKHGLRIIFKVIA